MKTSGCVVVLRGKVCLHNAGVSNRNDLSDSHCRIKLQIFHSFSDNFKSKVVGTCCVVSHSHFVFRKFQWEVCTRWHENWADVLLCEDCLRFTGDFILLGHPLGIKPSSSEQASLQVSPPFVEEDLEKSEGFQRGEISFFWLTSCSNSSIEFLFYRSGTIGPMFTASWSNCCSDGPSTLGQVSEWKMGWTGAEREFDLDLGLW